MGSDGEKIKHGTFQEIMTQKHRCVRFKMCVRGVKLGRFLKQPK